MSQAEVELWPLGLVISWCLDGAVEHMVPGWTRWSTWCFDGAVERVVLGWMRWSAWHLSGRGGEVPGWTRGRIWSLSGQGGAPEFYLFSQVTSDEVQEGSVKAEGACPSLGVGYSRGFIIGR